MATDINTIQNINKVFQSIAERHKFINSFGWGQDSNIGTSQEVMYPLLWVKPSAATMLKSEDLDRYAAFEVQLEVKVVDQIIKDNETNIDIESDSMQTLREIIVEFNDHPFYQAGYMLLVDDIGFEPLEEFNDDLASGWQCVVNLKLRNPYSVCDLPIDNLSGFYYSGGCTTESFQPTYLTCETVTACTSFQDFIAAAIAASPDNDNYTTGATYSNGIISFNRTDSSNAYNVDLTIISATTITALNEAWTIELMDAQTTSFYAPYNLRINSISNVLNSPTIALQDDGAAYSLTNLIASGSKIDVSASTASVITLNVTR